MRGTEDSLSLPTSPAARGQAATASRCLSSTSDHGRPLCTPKEYIAEEPGQPDRWFLYYIMLGFITSYRPGKSKSPGKPGSLDITQLVLNKI
ncbi:hypothetical protein Y1Q_0018033 [Alligator mississippiensis]|uniref:Uncharacterized protein n=1 Tax=Alligator mississippiensis TaxID=8496 RepID=A0A151MY88_ALLMI|nr:hypothetical protein Y1Q_0018033 [Alligator mississippiensis]